MHRRTLLVACWLVVAVVIPGVALADVGSTGPSSDADVQSQESLLQEDQPEPDNTVTRIELEADGSATWTLRFRTRLADEATVDDYRRFQESFRADTGAYLGPFRDRMTGVVANAEASTNREMRATGFEASTSIQEVPRRWGVVTYRFEWHGFAAAESDRVVVGDVFEGGFFIGEGDVLEIAPPDGYGFAEVDPTPDDTTDGVVEWRGREDFTDDRPRVAAEQGIDSSSGADSGGADRPNTEGGGVLLAVAAAISVLALLAAGLYVRRVRDSGVDDEGQPSSDDADDIGEPSLVTDEDQVLELLAQRDGRMKQSEIVDEFGWSKSKTSRLLSGMAEDGDIEKLRIGRENIIDLLEEEDSE